MQELRGPAIALIMAGCLNGAIALMTLLGGLFRLSGIGGEESLPTNREERIGFLAVTIASYGIALVTLIVAPLVIYGAVQMLNGRKYGIAKAAAILSIVPLTSCCFLVGIPIGIWGLIVLGKPEIKALFRGELPTGNFYPPQPPQNWQ